MKNNILNINAPKPSLVPKLKVLPVYKSKIAIAQGAGIVIVSVTDILYCQAQSNYCKIILKNGKEYLISKTLKRVQEVLSPVDFIKVHQSYFVALDAIATVDKGLILENGADIPISRAQRAGVMERLAKYYELV